MSDRRKAPSPTPIAPSPETIILQELRVLYDKVNHCTLDELPDLLRQIRETAAKTVDLPDELADCYRNVTLRQFPK